MSKMTFNPPKPVSGFPVELLELDHGESAIWLVRLRISMPSSAVECRLRYDAGKRITIDLPEEEVAREVLLAVRGESPARGNPLSDAIESLLPHP